MEIIEAGENNEGETSPLDAVAYESMTFRDIFIRNNLAPNVNGNTWERSVNDKVIYTVNSAAVDTPTIEYSEGEQDNYVPPYSMKIASAKSLNILSSKTSAITGVKGHTYLAAASINVTSYTAGKLGIAAGANSSFIGAEGKTNGYQRYVGLLEPTATSTGSVLFYSGSLNSANLTGYINNPVLVDTNIFKTIPSNEQWLSIYDEFCAIMREIYAQGGDIPPSVDVAADYVCAFKVPKYNARSFRNISLTPAYSKNRNTAFYPASMSKIMTAMAYALWLILVGQMR